MNDVRRVLITGSSGFIGRHLATQCETHWPNALIDRVDIVDGLDCREFFANSDSTYDVAIHCAAITGGIEGTTYNAAFQSAHNAQLDGAFFEWCLKVRPRRAFYFSSSCAYPSTGDDDPQQWTESDIDFTEQADGTPYGAVKLTGEIIAEAVRESGVPVSIVRPFAVYGSDQESCRMIPAFIDRLAIDESTFEVWGPGDQASDFIHVDDVVNAVLVMIDQDIDGPVNLGTGRGASVDEVAEIVLDAANISREITHRMNKPYGPPWRVGDPTLLETFYVPKVSLEDGIDRAIAAR